MTTAPIGRDTRTAYMDTDPNPPTDPQPNPAALAPQPGGNGAPSFSQADIDAAVKQARDSAWAEARRTFDARKPQGNPPQAARTDAAPAPQPVPVDVHAQIARHTVFTRAVSRFDLSDEAFDLVQEEFARATPEDPAGWVAKRAAAFGWKPTGAQPNPTQPNPAPGLVPGGAQQPPQPMPSGSPPSRVVTDDTRIVDMSPAERDALVARVGPTKYRDRLRAESRLDQRRIRLR